MDANAIKSSELYTAAKIVARECSEANLAFYECKKELGANPKVCKAQGKAVDKCVKGIMGQLNKKFPLEFKAYEACLDMNDFRAGDCRATETALLAGWNTLKGYTA